MGRGGHPEGKKRRKESTKQFDLLAVNHRPEKYLLLSRDGYDRG